MNRSSSSQIYLDGFDENILIEYIKWEERTKALESNGMPSASKI